MAQNGLGIMYAKGEGVPQDYSKALKWFGLAADKGDAGAQYNLGLMYAFAKAQNEVTWPMNNGHEHNHLSDRADCQAQGRRDSQG